MKRSCIVYEHVVVRGFGDGWYWVLWSANGTRMARSSTIYRSRKAAKRSFRSIVSLLSQNFGHPPIEEEIAQ